MTEDQTVKSAGLRVPAAAEVERLVTNRVRQRLLASGSLYQATKLLDLSAQRRLVALAAETGKSWPELPETRQHAVLTALIERIAVGVD